MAPRKTSPDDMEWAGTGENPDDWIHADGSYALETRDAALLGQYLREAPTPDPDIVRRLANLLDPPTKNSPRLQFVGGRGRPVEARNNDSNLHIRMMVRFALKGNKNKVEAAVAEVMKRTGKSRSAIFAAKGDSPTKPGKKSKTAWK